MLLPHYEIHSLIASGGMGAVYKGCQKDLDRMVAIKILPPEAGDDAESLTRFRSEARAMAKLNHPNIVSIYDFGAVDGQGYFVMEYVEGKNVHELIVDGAVAPELALNLLSQVCDALSYAHAKGIVHGDIKPSNVVVDADGVVKLLDFGLARLMEHDQSNEEIEWVPMGTPEYAAPELYERGAVADPRTDIYALGVVYYEMLLGTVPQGTFALPTTTMAVDPRVDDIIVRCLRPEPEERFQSAADVKQLLEDIRTGKPLPQAAATQRSLKPTTIVRPTVRRAVPGVTAMTNLNRIAKLEAEAKAKARKNMMIGGIVAAVLAALGGGALLMGPSKPTEPLFPTEPVAEPAEPEVKFAPPVPPPVTEPPTTAQAEPAKPEMKTEPDLTPEPEVAVPAPPKAPTAEPSPALAKLKEEYLNRYQTEIQSKIVTTEKDYGEKYLAALERLLAEFGAKNDATEMVRIRTESKRYAATNQAPSASEIAKSDKLAELQKKMITAFNGIRLNFKPAIAKLNAEFMEMLGRLSNNAASDGKAGEAATIKAFREAGLKSADYLGTLAGVVEASTVAAPAPAPPESPAVSLPTLGTPSKGAIAEGNVAQASRGAIAEALHNPDGLIDGIDEKENGPYSDEGGEIVITLDKVYQIEQVDFHMPRDEKFSFRYILEASSDGKTWEVLKNRTDEDCRGYQILDIPPQPIKAFRILVKGVQGTKHFIVEEVAAFCQGKKPAKPWGARNNTAKGLKSN